MIGAVTGRTVLVAVAEVGWQQVVDDVEQIGVTAGAGFDQCNAGGGVRAEDLHKSVTLSGNELCHLGRDVDGLRSSSSAELYDLRVQGQTV